MAKLDELIGKPVSAVVEAMGIRASDCVVIEEPPGMVERLLVPSYTILKNNKKVSCLCLVVSPVLFPIEHHRKDTWPAALYRSQVLAWRFERMYSND
jgi:hypothetical protein